MPQRVCHAAAFCRLLPKVFAVHDHDDGLAAPSKWSNNRVLTDTPNPVITVPVAHRVQAGVLGKGRANRVAVKWWSARRVFQR
jgi:hypothetical protein